MLWLDEKYGEPIEELLERYYVRERKSTIEISEELEIKQPTVYKYLRWFGIPLRSISDANKDKPKPESFRRKMRTMMKGRKITWGQKISESKRGKKLSEEHIRHSVEGRRGIPPWNKGKKGAQKSTRKGKTYEEIYGLERTREIKRKLSATMTGDTRRSKRSKKQWQNPQFVRKVLRGLFKKPNKSEARLSKIIKKYNLPLKYVGSGEVIIDGKVPDFIVLDDGKQVVELFGRPWHDPNHTYHSPKIEFERTEDGRKQFFRQRGYDCLIIWDDELNNEKGVAERIKSFVIDTTVNPKLLWAGD